jgi:hypothetical protein
MDPDFDNQLEAAIKRGQARNQAMHKSKREAALSAEEIRQRHNDFRLQLSDHIERSLKKLMNHFPGFRYETLYGSRGWGGAISRDDIGRGSSGRTGTFYSRLEITVRPLNEFNLVNITGKGTIRDKEVLDWNHFENISETDSVAFEQTIDRWVLEFAELFAAR